MKLRISFTDDSIGSVTQQRLGSIFQMKRCLLWLTSGLIFQASAIAGDVDPFVGMYKADIDFIPYTEIKKHGQRYFAVTPSGSAELVVKGNGSFKAKNASIDISGQFENKVDGLYQLKTVNLYGTPYVYEREEMAQQDYMSALYSDKHFFSEFSHPANEQCAAPYPDVEAASEQLLAQSPRMKSLVNKIEHSRFDYANINSLLILKDGKLVFERYFNGWQASDSHSIQSISKSVMSLLAGIAVKQGDIEDVSQPASRYLPSYKQYFEGKKGKITLRDLLTMSPGLYWDEWSKTYEDPENMRRKEIESDDSVAFTLSQRVSHAPGKQFTYSGGTVSVLGEALRVATKQPSVSDYAMKGPLSVLCFDNAFWMKQNDQRSNVAGGISLRPRDMMKLGQLVLDGGKWHGKQLIEPEWLSESTRPLLTTGISGLKYSYFWWNTTYHYKGKQYPAVLARGYGGQDIAIVKDLDLVVVKTAANFHAASLLGRMMVDSILPTFAN